MMAMYKKIAKNIYQEGKTLFRLRFTKKGKTSIYFLKTKAEALALRKKKLGF